MNKKIQTIIEEKEYSNFNNESGWSELPKTSINSTSFCQRSEAEFISARDCSWNQSASCLSSWSFSDGMSWCLNMQVATTWWSEGDKIIIPINMFKKSFSQRTIALNFRVSRELIYSLRRELRRKAKTKWEPYPKEIQRKISINQRHWILLRALRQIIFTGSIL